MATTYEIIDKATAGSGGVSSVTFSSIPQTYTDLKIVVSARQGSGGTDIKLTFNGSSTSYSNKRLFGTGSTAASDSANTTYVSNTMTDDSDFTANTFGNGEFYIPNYRVSGIAKSVSVDGVTENNATLALSMLTAGLWSVTDAITSITISAQIPNFVQHSSFYLYGIKNS
jgi:hypothetical protein